MPTLEHAIRRGARYLLAGLTAVLMSSGLTPAGWPVATQPTVALAGEDMCDGDPVIEVESARINITTHIPRSALRYATTANPVQILVYVPRNTKVAHQIAYSGVIPERLTFVYSASQHLIQHGGQAGQTAEITIVVLAPNPNDGSAPYPVQFDAVSALDQVSGSTTSGIAGVMTTHIPWKGGGAK